MCYSQTSTRCWGMHTACPALCPFDTTINGTPSAQQRGVKTIFHGVQPALATMKLKDGAFVQCSVKIDTHTHTRLKRKLSKYTSCPKVCGHLMLKHGNATMHSARHYGIINVFPVLHVTNKNNYYTAFLNAVECSIQLKGLPNVRQSIIFV